MVYNNNFFNFNGNPYYTPTSFDSDITNLAYHNFNQPCIHHETEIGLFLRNHLTCSRILYKDFSPLNQSVWKEYLPIGTDVLWTSRSIVNNPSIFVTDRSVCNRYNVTLFSSPSASSVTLISGYFSFKSNNQCSFLWHQLHAKFLCFEFLVKLSLLLFSFEKWTCPESSQWDPPVNWLSILSLLSRCSLTSLTLIVDLHP